MSLHNLHIKHLEHNLETSQTTLPNKIMLKCCNGYSMVPISSISHIIADGSYTKVYISNGTFIHSNISITSFEKILPMNLFCRCHNSYIIQWSFISKLILKDGCYFIMNEDSNIPVSRSRKKMILDKLKTIFITG